MDFSQRSQVHPGASTPLNGGASGSGNKRSNGNQNKWVRWGSLALLVVVTILVVAALLVLGFGGPKAEDSYVATNKLQAVFLNTGQVYFGDIKSLNSKYLVLDNIYYLQTSSTGTSTTSSNANTSVSLVKLGCELHSPYDQMIINRDQVTFWENLQDTGQVAKAVKTFEQQNPNGQKCADQSQSGTSGNSAVQGTSSSSSSGSSTTNNSSSTSNSSNSTTNP